MKQQRLKQKQTSKLTAKQIQLMQMVALSNTEVEDRIRWELENNPALEEGQEADYADEVADEIEAGQEQDDIGTRDPDDEMLGDYSSIDDVPDYKLRQMEAHRTPREEIPFAEADSLQEHLKGQIGLSGIKEKNRPIAEFVIGSLDADGYLRRDKDALIDDLAIRQGISTDRATLEEVIEQIRHLEPPGIGAYDLKDCLLLQLNEKPDDEVCRLAKEIVEQQFRAFSLKHYEKLMSRLKVSEEMLRAAIKLIAGLNPKPGLDYNTRLEDTLRTVIPDFFVEVQDGDLVIMLSDEGVAPVRLNKEFTHQMGEYTGDIRKVQEDKKEVARFVKQKIDDARWFVEALRQRRRTLLYTMQAIVEMQKAYFLSGDIALLRPLILQDIADVTGLDVSTISRVTSTKYVQTDFGIFSLKHFFSEGTTTSSGEEVSTRHVRTIIAELIEEEDKSHPMPDEEIVKQLKAKGLKVARRTVAKYRDQMGIPVARLRKEI